MAIGPRITGLLNRMYDRLRHPRAFELAGRPGGAGSFEILRGHKYALLVTFRRNGQPVPTPVWFGIGPDGHVYVRSETHVGKVKRLRRDPHVRIGPSDFRGNPKGELAEGHCRILDPSEYPRAEAALQANYGLFRRVYESVGSRSGVETLYLEIAPPA